MIISNEEREVLVQQLYHVSEHPMMECKKALFEANYDFDVALKILNSPPPKPRIYLTSV